jgi:hypothetical protein
LGTKNAFLSNLSGYGDDNKEQTVQLWGNGRSSEKPEPTRRAGIVPGGNKFRHGRRSGSGRVQRGE